MCSDVELFALPRQRVGDGDGVPELADVAGPVVAHEALEGAGGDALVGGLFAEVLEHAADEDGDVLPGGGGGRGASILTWAMRK